MKIVIDIPEEVYKAYKMDTSLGFLNEDQRDHAKWYLINGLVTGTPLPKGDGRLIILSEEAVKREQTPLGFSCQYWISEGSLSNATVAIIEAESEE